MYWEMNVEAAFVFMALLGIGTMYYFYSKEK